jgi:uncharacterized pyridoxamine 5'-phosphate oxidase family protein
MQNPELQKKIAAFLKNQKLAVIATIHPNQTPEAAVIQFAVTEELEIIFNTFSSYRKYKNLQENPAVAFVFGGEEKITVQYEGRVRELSGHELDSFKSSFLKKYPKAKKWDAFPETRWFLTKPRWIRYADLRTDLTNKQELTFLV